LTRLLINGCEGDFIALTMDMSHNNIVSKYFVFTTSFVIYNPTNFFLWSALLKRCAIFYHSFK